MRVAAAAAAAYALTALLKLPQGLWAVISAVIVVQGSVGGTLAASRDRLIGTLTGAAVGAAAVYLAPATLWGEGLGLMLSVAVLAWGAAKSPSLRIGPVTATIVILSGGPHGGMTFAAERVGEIVLGSMVGLAATLFVIPARARQAAVGRAGVLLGQLQEAFRLFAEALDKGEPPAEIAALNAQIRASLTALETLMAEVVREARAHLAPDDLSEALPRTLWRVRNDAIVIGRTLSRPFSAEIRSTLAAPAHALLEAARLELDACRNALIGGVPTPPSPVPAAAEAFRCAFAELRSAGLMRDLGFEEIGHVFGLAWAFEAMERNLADLADRVDESVPHRPRRGISPFGPGARRARVESSGPLGQGTADGEFGGR